MTPPSCPWTWRCSISGHREAVAALVLFRKAVREEQVTAAFVRELAAYLDTARTDPTLRFRQPPA